MEYGNLCICGFCLIANDIVQDIVPLCEGGNGLLGQMLSAGLEMKDVQRIVADLLLAAGDTVTNIAQVSEAFGRS